jgi:hypothetical protein
VYIAAYQHFVSLPFLAGYLYLLAETGGVDDKEARANTPVINKLYPTMLWGFL